MPKGLYYSRKAAGDHPQQTAGSAQHSTVVATEYGDRGVHKTILKLTDVPVSIVSVTTGNGVGGRTLYTMPQGRIAFLGGMANLSCRVHADDQEDYTDATPEGDLGIGTLAPANANALGTDATDDNLCTAAAFTMAAFEDASVHCASEASGQQFDGTSTPKDVVLTALVDAADIDDGVTTTLLVSGTVELLWSNLGDF